MRAFKTPKAIRVFSNGKWSNVKQEDIKTNAGLDEPAKKTKKK